MRKHYYVSLVAFMPIFLVLIQEVRAKPLENKNHHGHHGHQRHLDDGGHHRHHGHHGQGGHHRHHEHHGHHDHRHQHDDEFVVVGDMVLTRSQYKEFYHKPSRGKKKLKGFRNGASSFRKRWKNNVVPYVFNETSKPVSKELRDRVESELGVMNDMLRGCVLFRPATEQDRDVLMFHESNSCASNVGKVGFPLNTTNTWLMSNCPSVLHEVIHVLGFMHEFVRPDRDRFIRIDWENIQPVFANNFLKSSQHALTFEVPFNFYSLMSYQLNAFAKDKNKHSLHAKKSGVEEQGIRSSWIPAKTDLIKIRRMYNCREPELRCPEKWKVVGRSCVKAPEHGRKTWVQAFKACSNLNKKARLYEPRDYEDYVRIKRRLGRNNAVYEVGPFWIGVVAKSGQEDKPFHPSDRAPMAFPRCGPSMTKAGCNTSGKKNCGVLLFDSDRRMQYLGFENCAKELHYICEIPEEI